MNVVPTLVTLDLEQQQLHQALQQVKDSPEIILCKASTESTNNDVLELYQQGYRSALVVSHLQHQGRGQHQREWVSPPGNLYFSILVELEKPVDGRFSLECGLSLLYSPLLKDFNHLQLKWANDLYSAKGKWGGILIEPITSTQIIIGVGINIQPFKDPSKIPQKVTSLQELGLQNYDRVSFISYAYQALLEAVQWYNFGSQNLAKRFNQVAAFKDSWIVLSRENQEQLTGYFRGIQDDGALLIQAPSDIFPTVCYDGRLVLPNE